jgi:hypothetical protein
VFRRTFRLKMEDIRDEMRILNNEESHKIRIGSNGNLWARKIRFQLNKLFFTICVSISFSGVN